MHRRGQGRDGAVARRPLPHPLRPAAQRQPGARARLPHRRRPEAGARHAQPQDRRRELSVGGAPRGGGMEPGPEQIPAWTDHYFLRTKKAIERFGDREVTYAVFMRRPVISAPRLAIAWLNEIAAERNTRFTIDLRFAEGKWVGAGEPLMYVSGSFRHLVDLETIMLQKLGPACVAAFNAFTMCADLPQVAFLAMDARHCAGTEMADIMAYAASVGSARARRKVNAKGFVGNATEATAHYFGQAHAMGTMPHALIGYAGSTVGAAEMYHETFPGEPMTVLVDYFGREVSDSLAVCRRFPEMATEGRLGVRIDTAGSRFVEGLDPSASYAV